MTRRESRVIMIHFLRVQVPVEQRKLREKLHVVVFSGLRRAGRTEKSARKAACGRLFGTTKSLSNREICEKSCMWSSFPNYERPVEQRNLREKLHVVVFSGLRRACRTEKPARNDACGRLFGTTKSPSYRETSEKRCLWSSFSDFEGLAVQRNQREKKLVVVFFVLRRARRTEKPARNDVCGCLFWTWKGNSNRGIRDK